MNPLRSNQLYIRPFQLTDQTPFTEAVLESLDSVGKWMTWCTPDYSESNAHDWILLSSRNVFAGTSYDVGIFASDTGRLLGGISINQINREHQIGNIGYWIRQSAQGQGVASEAVRMIARFGFDELKLARLEIVAITENHASRRVAERAGAQFECVARNRLQLKGRSYPAAVYSLIKSDLY